MDENIKETQKTKQPESGKRAKQKRIVLLSILGVLILAMIGCGVFVWHILRKPEAFFDRSTIVASNETPDATPLFDVSAYLPADGADATPIPTRMPADAAQTGADGANGSPAIEKLGVVNIALFGIDAYEDGSSTSGSMPHTDANLILAINFDTKEVSLISIARDCLTTVPGHSGFYKFNGVFNVGGGMDDPNAGFELSCRAAEMWLGGVSVPYYYGVDFQALIELVDMIGGIDFDLDIPITTFEGRKLDRGFHHLNGQEVMAYVRMRKSVDGTDKKRTERQRKMLVAIFKKLKQEGKLSMVPELLRTMGDNVYTNTTLAQTASLASFANEIDPDGIRTYSVQGKMSMAYDWAFCFIDQDARIDMLKTVYGIDASPLGFNSAAYEKFLHQDGFRAILYMNITKKLFAAVHGIADETSMTEEQKTAYAQCWKDYSDLQAVYAMADEWRQLHYEGKSGQDDAKQFEEYLETMRRLENRLQKSADALNGAFGDPIKARWNYRIENWFEKGSDINEVYVDFR